MPSGSIYTYVGNADAQNGTGALELSQGTVVLGGWGYFLPAEYNDLIGQGYILEAGQQSSLGPTAATSTPARVVIIVNTGITANAGNTVNTDYIYFGYSGSTITLPPLPSSAAVTNRYTIKNIDVAGTFVTVATYPVTNIEGNNQPISVPSLNSVDLVTDGTNWWVI
jgi:hypothetical protein